MDFYTLDYIVSPPECWIPRGANVAIIIQPGFALVFSVLYLRR